MTLKKAVLLISWNRLDTTQKVFEQIKIAKPPKLYLASDGARSESQTDTIEIEKVRKWLLDNIDWNCEVKTRFLDKNSGGCANGVSSAITWFFENEPDGIILEDDCMPSQSFFYFCEELLDYYKDNKKVWHISGNHFSKKYIPKESYYFTKIMHCWGWASWADRWQHFNLDLSNYDESNIKKFSNNKRVQTFWKKVLYWVKNKEIDTWDYSWTFWIIANNGYCINPSKNLISNIGVNGVHMVGDGPFMNLKRFEIDNIVHPKNIEFNNEIIEETYRNNYGIKFNLVEIFHFMKRKPLFLFRKDFYKLVFGY